jgi:hypothetical protein
LSTQLTPLSVSSAADAVTFAEEIFQAVVNASTENKLTRALVNLRAAVNASKAINGKNMKRVVSASWRRRRAREARPSREGRSSVYSAYTGTSDLLDRF